MGDIQDSGNDPLAEIRDLAPIECGEDAAKHFAFARDYTNLNHGAYGTYPVEVRSIYRYYHDQIEARPDVFTRYEYRPKLLDQSRRVLSNYLDIPMETCAYAPNATTAFDTVIRNLVYKPGDAIICFAAGYTAFNNTIIYLTETTPVEMRRIQYNYPVSDDYICDAFKTAIQELRESGKKPIVAVFDTVNSEPALRMPFERLTELCRTHGILSCIDGAHGVGQFDLNLRKLDPDFFTSNCHKWLHVPRGCALLYVPLRNQHLMRSTLPTGFAFVPLPGSDAGSQSLANDGKNAFTANFASTGTLDDSSYICVEAAIEWRKKLRWSERGLQGDEAIKAYNMELAERGGQAVADILGTEVLDNEEHSLTRCAMRNIRLPISDELAMGDSATSRVIAGWIQRVMTVDYRTAVTILVYGCSWYVRMSAQVYLTLQDFDRAGRILKETCERANQGAWRQQE